MPGPRALWFSGGAPNREEDSMPSRPVDGASDDHARIFSPPHMSPPSPPPHSTSDTPGPHIHHIIRWSMFMAVRER